MLTLIVEVVKIHFVIVIVSIVVLYYVIIVIVGDYCI